MVYVDKTFPEPQFNGINSSCDLLSCLMKFNLHTCLLPFLLLFPPLAWSNMEFAGDVSIGTNDNVSSAVSGRDIFNDQFLSANYNLGKLWVPTPGRSFLLRGHLGLQNFSDSDGLNRTAYGASLSYAHRLGLGAFAPRINMSARADYRDFESNNRDGWLFRTSIGLQKRFSPAWHGSMALTHEHRTADKDNAKSYVAGISGDVFNQENMEYSASLDYTLANASVITLSYLFRDGEIDASTNPGSVFFPFSRAIANDKNLCGNCKHYVAYLIKAQSSSIMLDWNWALGRDTSLSLNMQRRIADTEGNNTYSTNIFQLRLNQRF